MRSLRERGECIVLSAFGRNGDGGFGSVTEHGIDVIDRISSKGIDSDGDFAIRVLDSTGGVRSWARWGEIATYDVDGLLRLERINGVGDVHDVVLENESLLLVSTANDSVVRLKSGAGYRPSMEVVYSTGHDCDFTHVNCIWRDGNRFVATAFTTSNNWSWRTNLRKGKRDDGLLFDLATGEVLVDGLSRPHSPRRWKDQWVIATAGDNSVVVVSENNDRKKIEVGGFTRGLFIVNDLAFVATSPLRRSLNTIELQDMATESSSCQVVVVDLRTEKVVDAFDVPFAGVYDITVFPAALVEGIRRGGAMSAMQPFEQAENQQILNSPRGATWLGPINEEHRRASIEASVPTSMPAGSTVSVPVRMTNLADRPLLPRGDHRSVLGWWWDDPLSRLRGGTGFMAPVEPLEELSLKCQIEVPTRPGLHRLTLGVVQEGAGWFAGQEQFEVEVSDEIGTH
jgi:uncharacterized protein (TIGR03032 family)